MKKRMIAALLALVMLTMSGCSLALEAIDGDGVPMNDQLIGMYVTVSVPNGTSDDGTQYYSSIWDDEVMGMEPLHSFQSKGQRLYAEQAETEIETFDGVLTTQHPYLFPGDYGLVCMTFYEQETGENIGFWNNVTDAEFSDNTKHMHTTDDRTRIDIESTIYVADTVELHDLTLYMNPVYQTPEGEVYALGTAPVGYDGVSMDGCSQSVSQEARVTLPNGVKTSGGSIKLTIKRAVLPESYIILEMDEHNQVVATGEYAPEEMPETYVPSAQAAYLILESRGAERTVRTVYSPDDEIRVMDTFYPGRYGICVKGYTLIDWEG